MEGLVSREHDLLNELHTKWTLIDMKSRIIQTICSLIDDQVSD